MRDRISLQHLLEELMPENNKNVYYQPPESIKMKYPAIVYSINRIDNRSANDGIYVQNKSYSLTVIDKNPDSEIVNDVSKLPKCRFDRYFVSNNLNHTIFTLYY